MFQTGLFDQLYVQDRLLCMSTWVSDTLTTLCNIFCLPGRLTCVPGRPLGYRFVLTWILGEYDQPQPDQVGL